MRFYIYKAHLILHGYSFSRKYTNKQQQCQTYHNNLQNFWKLARSVAKNQSQRFSHLLPSISLNLKTIQPDTWLYAGFRYSVVLCRRKEKISFFLFFWKSCNSRRKTWRKGTSLQIPRQDKYWVWRANLFFQKKKPDWLASGGLAIFLIQKNAKFLLL